MLSDVIFPVLLAVAAFVAAVIVVVGGGAALQWGKDRQVGLLPYIYYGIIATAAIATLTSGRNLYLPGELVSGDLEKSGMAVWANRFTSIFMLLAASERIVHYLFKFKGRPRIPVVLLIGFCVFYGTNILSSAVFGFHRSFAHDYLYPLLVGIAAMFMAESEADSAIEALRNVLSIFLVIGIAFIAIRPELVLSKDYEGLLPGLTVRFAGMAQGPNALGPLAAVFMLCLFDRPFKRRLINRFAWTVAIVSFVLAQSKSSWIAFIVSALCVGYFRYQGSLKDLTYGRKSRIIVIPIYALMAFTVLVFSVIMFTDVGGRLDVFLRSRAGADLMSMTGRDQIWELALAEWRAHPVFGYGLTLWNADYRAKMLTPWAYHSHNQFYQSLATAGVVGLIGLMIYLSVLVYCAVKTARATRGLSLALLLLILTRTISEVPFALTGFGLEQMVHILLLMVLAAYMKSVRADSKPNVLRFASIAPAKESLN